MSSEWTWLVIAALVLLVILAVVFLARRRSSALRQRFGPEYNRAVEASGVRAGEAELADRARRHHDLHIVPLAEPERLAYADMWRTIQEHFVDRPTDAVDSAERLLTEVMDRRGYPTTTFEEQADLVSVEHPQMVQDYRIAHAIHERNQDRQASTEDLREALLRYRSLFDGLLQAPSDFVTNGRGRIEEPDPAGRTRTGQTDQSVDGVAEPPPSVSTHRGERLR